MSYKHFVSCVSLCYFFNLFNLRVQSPAKLLVGCATAARRGQSSSDAPSVTAEVPVINDLTHQTRLLDLQLSCKIQITDGSSKLWSLELLLPFM